MSGDGGLIAEYKNSTTYFIHKDHLGSTRLVTNASGGTTDWMDYLPYGEQISGNSTTSHKFTGKELDSESGLNNFSARYDSSTLGRFTTADWAAKPTNVPYANFGNPQSLNLYSYANNNPTTTRDPDGHCVPVCEIVSQIVMYVTAHTAQVGTGVQATRNEYRAKVAQQTTGAGRDSVKTEMRAKGPALGRALAQQAAEDPSRVAARSAKTAEQLAESVNRTSPAANAMADTLGKVGKVAGAVSVGIAVYDAATAPEGQKLETAAEKGGGLGGALGGGEIGAEAGLPFGPWGAAGGGTLGAIAGGFFGEAAVKSILAPSNSQSKPTSGGW